LRNIPQRLEPWHGGRHATRSGRFADEGNQVGADMSLVIVNQSDGCAVGMRAISGVFEKLNDEVITGGDAVVCHIISFLVVLVN
jgi:hypothetical protein